MQPLRHTQIFLIIRYTHLLMIRYTHLLPPTSYLLSYTHLLPPKIHLIHPPSTSQGAPTFSDTPTSYLLGYIHLLRYTHLLPLKIRPFPQLRPLLVS